MLPLVTSNKCNKVKSVPRMPIANHGDRCAARRQSGDVVRPMLTVNKTVFTKFAACFVASFVWQPSLPSTENFCFIFNIHTWGAFIMENIRVQVEWSFYETRPFCTFTPPCQIHHQAVASLPKSEMKKKSRNCGTNVRKEGLRSCMVVRYCLFRRSKSKQSTPNSHWQVWKRWRRVVVGVLCSTKSVNKK